MLVHQGAVLVRQRAVLGGERRVRRAHLGDFAAHLARAHHLTRRRRERRAERHTRNHTR